jgi:hypothetical protein
VPRPQAAVHCDRCHRSFADRPAYDSHRLIARPCIRPVLLGQRLLDNRGWGWPARSAR